jgi:hypothetical protein
MYRPTPRERLTFYEIPYRLFKLIEAINVLYRSTEVKFK